MISKSRQKLIRSLQLKKNRLKEGLFVAEGPKVAGDLMAVMQPRLIVATAEWLSLHEGQLRCVEVIEVDDEGLRQTSFLQHPQQVMGVFPLPEGDDALSPDYLSAHLSLALDGVQDPGNLGTIIRIADWFGIGTIVCSPTTADAWSPKVVQATMGSIARVRVAYADLRQLLASLPGDLPVYGTLLDGNDIFAEQLSAEGIIVMGNEGNGISEEIRPLISHRLLIPSYPPGRATADSLNVATATAITCAEFRRRAAGRGI